MSIPDSNPSDAARSGDEDGDAANRAQQAVRAYRYVTPDLHRLEVWQQVTAILPEPHPVADTVIEFVDSITSFADRFIPLIDQLEQDAAFAHVGFKEAEADPDGATVSPELLGLAQSRYDMPLSKQTPVLIARRAYANAEYARRNLPRVILLGLIAEYDAFLAHLISAILAIRPELTRRIEKGLTMTELETVTSLAEARAFLVEKEIESALRKSHNDQLAWFERWLGLANLRDSLDAYDAFIELTERRNLVAHTGGRVTSRYIQLSKVHDFGLGNLPVAVGQEFDLGKDYLKHVTDVVIRVGVELSQLAWRTVQPDELWSADKVLSRLCYNLLVFEEFALARDLLTFAVDVIPKYSTHYDAHEKQVFVINLAQSWKWLGNQAACEETLRRVDWSGCDAPFVLSTLVLRDEIEEAERLMRTLGENNTLKKTNFRDWPVYREFRRTPGFQQAYKDLYDEELPQEAL